MVIPSHIAVVLCGGWQLLNSTPTYLNGTDRPPNQTGMYGKGILIYHEEGFMSANTVSSIPEDIPPVRSGGPTPEDLILIGNHTISYAGVLSLKEGSNETHGTLTHGPLFMATVPSWRDRNMTRNYIITKGAYEGRDVLHLWLRNEADDSIANIHWARLPPTEY